MTLASVIDNCSNYIIASAKLLLTDRLINATAPLSTEGAEHIETVEE